jgi:multidrug efflux system outer membrane protein
MRIALSLAALLALSACAVGPDYEHPEVATPSQWRIPLDEAESIARNEWWRGFGDPVLDGLIETAIANNLDLRIAAARVEQFAAQLEISGSDLFPQIGYGASATQQRASERGNVALPPGTDPVSDLYRATLNLSWELDLWGRIRRANEAARADLLAAEEARRGAVLTLVSSVATSYVALRGLDAQLEIARETLASRQESLRLFELQLRGGVASELQVAQVRSELEQARAAIPALERRVTQLENALSVLLGGTPGPIPRGRSLDALTLPAVPGGLPAELLTQRPDIRRAEQNLIAANARIGVARAAYLPSISLTGLLGLESAELSDLVSNPARIWQAGGQLAGPIFTGGALSGQVALAEAVQRELLASYQAAILAGLREVEDALIDYRSTGEELIAQRRRAEALRDYVRLAQRRYDNGYSSYIEVLDAERSLFSAELNVAETQGREYAALVSLYKALGGGWVTSADAELLDLLYGSPEASGTAPDPQP